MMVCKLCLEDKDLCKSHIIPDSIFKKIKKDGVATHVSSDLNAPVLHNGFTYYENMLCLECERHLNLSYENYALKVFRAQDRDAKIQKGQDRVRLTRVCAKTIHLFLLSVFWRAAVSEQNIFSHRIVFPEEFVEYARNCLREGRLRDDLGYVIDIARLTCTEVEGFDSDKLLREIVGMPFNRSSDDGVAFHWVAMGFVFSFVFAYSRIGDNSWGVVRTHGRKITAPYVHIGSIPEVCEVLDTIPKRAQQLHSC